MKSTTLYAAALFFLSLMALDFASCCKDEPCDDPTDRLCPNFDPCLVTPSANSNFFILDSFYQGGNQLDTFISFNVDTTWSGSSLFFRAADTEHIASYQWQVGSHSSVIEDPIFELDFTGFTGNVPVRLITTAKDEHQCLKEEDQVDTTYKNLVILPFDRDNIPILSTYKGSIIGKPETELLLTTYDTTINFVYNMYLQGLSLDCEPLDLGIPILVGYDYFITAHSHITPRCRNLTAIGQLQKDNRDILQVDYFYDDDAGKRRHEVFVGHRQ